MAGSVTVLPAILSKLGDRIEKGRVPFTKKARKAEQGEAGMWAAILERVLRRPVLSMVLSTGLLVVLAIPAFSLHTLNLGVQGIPKDLPVKKTYDRIQAEFPGDPLAATVAVTAPIVECREMRTAIASLRIRAVSSGSHRRMVNEKSLISSVHSLATAGGR